MNIDLNSTQIQSLVAEALLTQIDAAARENLIKQALVYLMTPEKRDFYGQPASPLQQAFNSGVCSAAEKIILAEIQENGEIVASIRSLIQDAVQKLTVDNRDELVAKLARSIGDGLLKKEY